MFNKFKYVWQRLAACVDGQFEGNLARQEKIDYRELDTARQRLIRLRARQQGITSTSNLDVSTVRQRITQEIETRDCVTTRLSDRNAIGKWFGKEEQKQSGLFDAIDFNHRIRQREIKRTEEMLDPLPALEDTFMAFSKPEEDLFEDNERITLSGVNYSIDPLEELEEEFTMKALPMYESDQAPVESLDQSFLEADQMAQALFVQAKSADSAESQMDFSPVDENEEAAPVNPYVHLLGDLEQRLFENRQRDNFWVV